MNVIVIIYVKELVKKIEPQRTVNRLPGIALIPAIFLPKGAKGAIMVPVIQLPLVT